MSGGRSKHLKLAVQIVRKVSAAHRAGPRTCCVDADAVQNGRISDVRALRPNRKDVSRECRVSILSEEKPGRLQFLRDRHCLAESPNLPPAVHSTGIRRIGEKHSLPKNRSANDFAWMKRRGRTSSFWTSRAGPRTSKKSGRRFCGEKTEKGRNPQAPPLSPTKHAPTAGCKGPPAGRIVSCRTTCGRSCRTTRPPSWRRASS